MLDMDPLNFTEAKVYHNKLVNIRKEMITLHDKTSKLKQHTQQSRPANEMRERFKTNINHLETNGLICVCSPSSWKR
uniref:Uncharacterized protein n=1 Tax=Pygocentrus nattereri TaxID=42514 RepID=A0AAR2JG61_PYGNA